MSWSFLVFFKFTSTYFDYFSAFGWVQCLAQEHFPTDTVCSVDPLGITMIQIIATIYDMMLYPYKQHCVSKWVLNMVMWHYHFENIQS